MNFKKSIIVAAAGTLLFGALATGVFATSGNFRDWNWFQHNNHYNGNNKNFNADIQLQKSQCGQNLGKPIIDVTLKTQNDVDDGYNTNADNVESNWAFDYYNKHIQVWPTGTWNVTGTYTFDTIYLGNPYNYSVTLSQSVNIITGSLDDSYGPGVLPIINGSLSGNTITFSVNYGSSSSQGTRTFTGTIDSSGHMTGKWTETGPEKGSDTWSATVGVATISNSYCAVVTYDGQFYAIPGQLSPGYGYNAQIGSPVNGDMDGGYRATFNATFAPSDLPNWPTNGKVASTINNACVVYLSKDNGNNCKGAVDWLSKYFTSTEVPAFNSFNEVWWGWKYDGGSHGTWIDASDLTNGSLGNIQ